MSHPIACPDCHAYYQANRDALIPACASVGIEEGRSQGEMLRIYMASYHREGHREPERTP